MTSLVLLARVGDQTVAFDATAIESVTDLKRIVPVPYAPEHVHGLCALRSQVATVVDCGRATGNHDCGPTGRALITQIDGHRYALRVDAVEDVVTCAVEPLAEGDRSGAGWSRIAVGRIDLGDRFAIAVDPMLIVNAQPAQSAF